MTDIDYKGFTIKIEADEYPENPREWDNLGTMVCFHGRYELGDKTDYREEDQNSWQELKARLVKDGAAIVLPLYLYDHSGLRIKVGSFNGLLPQGHAEFDSGQVGFIFITAEKIREEYSVKRITAATLKKVAGYLENEVKTYDQYLSGDVYSYSIEDADGETVDSCGGYFGYDEAEQAAREAVDYEVKARAEAKEKKLKKYIRAGVALQYRKF